jgi:oxygen-independent coproporphyrinogen-3 oxidase
VSGIYDPEKADNYIEALKKEIGNIPCNTQLSTFFIGGGTPTVLSAALLSDLINNIFTHFDFTENYEATIEANPGTIDAEKLNALRSAGMNRISIGIQSFHDDELAFLGRSHNSNEAEEAVYLARDAGFENIGIDLIYGIPGQTQSSWKQTLENAVRLKPEHISTYELTVEEGTVLYEYLKNPAASRCNASRQQDTGPFFKERDFPDNVKPDEEKIISMYEYAIDYLTSGGYIHYEISNFALPDHFCKHNLNYWDRGEYYGAGPGAHSFINGKRFFNTDNLDDYLKALSDNKSPVKGTENIFEDKALTEAIFLGLRKTEGINLKAFSERYKKDMLQYYSKEIEELQSEGLIEFTGSNGLNSLALLNCSLKLTRKGILLSNEIFTKFVK